MISLHVYLTAKPGKERELEAGIKDKWLAAMAKQPGFVSCALVTPFTPGTLEKLGALKPQHTFEVIAFWRSEEERLAWVARPIHNEVFLPLQPLATKIASTLQTVAHSRNLLSS